MRFLLQSILALACASSLATASAQHLYTFGDSLSDNGNFYIASGGTYPPLDTYSWGRASNGSTWSARIGYHMGHAPNAEYLREPYGGFQGDLTGWNFAHYGATIDPSLMSTNGQKLPNQVDFFQSLANDGTFWIDPNDAFTIWAGTNDYLARGANDPSKQVSILMEQVLKIDSVRGKNIMVFDLPLWGNTPIGASWWNPQALNDLITSHNSQLAAAIDSLKAQSGVDVYYVPISELFTDVRNNPAEYGFTVVMPGNGSTGHCLGDGLVLNDCPSTYAFYDAVHPTSAMHRWIGNFGRAQYFAIQAAKEYSAIATSASAPALAYQEAAISGNSANLVSSGWSTHRNGPVELVSYHETQSADANSFAMLSDGLNNENSFSLMGARADLPSGIKFGFAVSSGTPDLINNPAQAVTASSGWAVQLEKAFGQYTARLKANGIEQAYQRQRATGFGRDPVVTAAYEQMQSTVTFGFDRSVVLLGADVTAGASFGFARQDRSGVRETGLTDLVSMNSPAEHYFDEVSEFHLSFARGGDMGWADLLLGADLSAIHINGQSYSAWSALGAHDFTHYDHLAARRAAIAAFYSALLFDNGWSTQARFAYGESDIETVSSAQVKLGYSW